MSECNVVERWNTLRQLAGMVELRGYPTSNTIDLECKLLEVSDHA